MAEAGGGGNGRSTGHLLAPSEPMSPARATTSVRWWWPASMSPPACARRSRRSGRLPAAAARRRRALRDGAAEGRRAARPRRRPGLRRPPWRRRARPGGEAPLPHHAPGHGGGRLMDVDAILAEVRSLADRGDLHTIVARYGSIPDTPPRENPHSTHLPYQTGRAFGTLCNQEKVERYLL